MSLLLVQAKSMSPGSDTYVSWNAQSFLYDSRATQIMDQKCKQPSISPLPTVYKETNKSSIVVKWDFEEKLATNGDLIELDLY